MHIQTHVMTGWCIANVLPGLDRRQRLFCMIAAAIPDLDGLSRLAGEAAYFHWHHRAGHNLVFAVVSSVALAMFSQRKLWSFLIYLAQFHLHLVMDVFGSGPGWGILYFWPFSTSEFDNTQLSWAFYSWQNITFAAVAFAGSLAIVFWKRRTPLEAVMPKLDRQLVAMLTRKEATEPRNIQRY